jgi:hypothetical protein
MLSACSKVRTNTHTDTDTYTYTQFTFSLAAGFGSSWHLAKVEVVNLITGEQVRQNIQKSLLVTVCLVFVATCVNAHDVSSA